MRLFPCFLYFFMELSKKRRKRIRKRAQGRMCAYAREQNTWILTLFPSTHSVWNENIEYNPDNP